MKYFQLTNFNTESDLFGAFASGLCLIHCLITPFIFVAQAAYSADSCATAPLWWGIIDYLFLVISFVAIHHSAKHTTSNWVPKALYGSWVFLAIMILNERFHFLPVPHALLYLPAVALIGLHLYNRRYCNCKDDEYSVPSEINKASA